MSVALRPPGEVMRLARFGAMLPTRLSFLRMLTARLAAERSVVSRPVWELSPEGYGRAVLSVPLGGRSYSLVAITRPLDDANRTDRVIATAWDAAFVLYDGVPDAAELDRIAAAAPRQEAGRFTARDLVLSRANKSVRLFSEVVAALRAGRDLDFRRLAATGYLMRTTAVYGNGKFGIADRAEIASRPGLAGPFAAEMLTVWLIRSFTHDLVAHMGGRPLPMAARRALGIGNSTGLGMAPFLVSHPLLLHRWMQARETALAKARALPVLTPEARDRVLTALSAARAHLANWQVDDTGYAVQIADLEAAARMLDSRLPALLAGPNPIDAVYAAAAPAGIGAQELAVSLALEAEPALVDPLAETMAAPEPPALDPAMDCAVLAAHIARDWDWALRLDLADPVETTRFWYVSQDKREPRIGNRHTEPGSELESPLDIARRVQALASDLAGAHGPLAIFLRGHPEHRFAVRRVQLLAVAPYAELRDNLIAARCRPIDMLRTKLALFGATGFDPRSDLWLRVTLAAGAALPEDVAAGRDPSLPLPAPLSVRTADGQMPPRATPATALLG